MSKESFTTTAFPGQQMTTGWVNSAGRLLNRIGQFLPGSTMSGVRTGSWDADLPFPKTIVLICEVVGAFDVNGDLQNPPQDTVLDIQNPEIIEYGVRLLRFETTTNLWEIDDQDTVHRASTYWLENQFLAVGDRIMILWDYVAGKFIAVQPPLIRLARILEDVAQGQLLVEVDTIAMDDAGLITRLAVQLTALHPCGNALSQNTFVVIGYAQPMRRWLIIEDCEPPKMKHVEFALEEELDTNTESVQATVSLVYEEDATTPTVGETIDVFNPEALCGPDAFMFTSNGADNCRGMAVFHEGLQQWRIWQLECEP